jgi:hypothetical protein
MSFKVPVISKYEWQRAAKSILSSPPVIPIKGDRYIIGSNPINSWVGYENYISEYNGTIWEFTTPFPGMIVYISGKNKMYKYTNRWNDLIVAGGETVVIESIGKQLTIDEFNLTINCDSATTQLFILPDITTQCIGGWIRFIKTGSGTLTIQAGVNDCIADSGLGDTIYCDVVSQNYSTLKLLCASIGMWVITGGHGTWTTTESG